MTHEYLGNRDIRQTFINVFPFGKYELLTTAVVLGGTFHRTVFLYHERECVDVLFTEGEGWIDVAAGISRFLGLAVTRYMERDGSMNIEASNVMEFREACEEHFRKCVYEDPHEYKVEKVSSTAMGKRRKRTETKTTYRRKKGTKKWEPISEPETKTENDL